MRLPLDMHILLRTYIDRFNLDTAEFINSNQNRIAYLNKIEERVNQIKGAENFHFNVKDSKKRNGKFSSKENVLNSNHNRTILKKRT